MGIVGNINLIQDRGTDMSQKLPLWKNWQGQQLFHCPDEDIS
jgi:hypothetical protein